MKHFLISLALLLVFGTNTFASDTMVSPNVLRSFQKKFSTAKEVSWSAGNEIYKAEFVYSDQYITAYYDADGSLLALTKNISSTQLPLLLGKSLKENYEGYWISALVEVSTQFETTYYATLETADSKVILQSTQNRWSVDKKIKK
ncbi:MAG: hypothetical protein ACTHOF_08630 [Flavisolibacter sp.]